MRVSLAFSSGARSRGDAASTSSPSLSLNVPASFSRLALWLTVTAASEVIDRCPDYFSVPTRAAPAPAFARALISTTAWVIRSTTSAVIFAFTTLGVWQQPGGLAGDRR